MTYLKIQEHLENGGYIDCGNDDAVKLQVLDILEEIGFDIGFDKSESVYYRYVCFEKDIDQIHMTDHIASESEIITYNDVIQEPDFDVTDLSELYEWM